MMMRSSKEICLRGYMMTDKKSSFSFDFSVDESKEYELWIKVYEGGNGNLIFYINNKQIGEINPPGKGNEYK